MLYRYILVSQLLCLILCADQHLVQVGSYINLSSLYLGAFGQGLLHTAYKMFLLNLHLLYQLQNQAVLHREQAVEKMFLLNLLVAVFIGKLFTAFHGLHGFLCKFLYVHRIPPCYASLHVLYSI